VAKAVSRNHFDVAPNAHRSSTPKIPNETHFQKIYEETTRFSIPEAARAKLVIWRMKECKLIDGTHMTMKADE
jgi:hypothetical protein